MQLAIIWSSVFLGELFGVDANWVWEYADIDMGLCFHIKKSIKGV